MASASTCTYLYKNILIFGRTLPLVPRCCSTAHILVQQWKPSQFCFTPAGWSSGACSLRWTDSPPSARCTSVARRTGTLTVPRTPWRRTSSPSRSSPSRRSTRSTDPWEVTAAGPSAPAREQRSGLRLCFWTPRGPTPPGPLLNCQTCRSR